MAEIINLRMARKAAKRLGEQARAAANRARHGQSASLRAAQKQTAERLARQVDGARMERSKETQIDQEQD